MELEPVPSESEAVVASIDDLLLQILIRLPMKPLVRFKSVSKHWNSLISDPKFSLAFGLKPNPATGLIFQSSPYEPLLVKFDKSSTTATDQSTDLWRRNAKALNSCNGLLLCASSSHPYRRYSVCNNTTGKYCPVLKLGWDAPLAGIFLAFDPAKSHHFSVVGVYRLDKSSKGFECRHQIKVFSSEAGCWRESGEPFKARADFRRGVYWNGCVHWLCYSDKSIYFNPNEQTPAIKFMPAPPLLRFPHSLQPSHYFGESGGHLNFIENAYDWGGELIVHEMKGDYSGWFVKYRVVFNRSTIMDWCSIRALVRGEEDEDSFLVFLVGKRLSRLNLADGTVEVICSFEDNVAGSKYYYDQFLHQDFPLHYIKSTCSI